MTDVLLSILPTIVMAIIGAISTVWVYITERRKRRLAYHSAVGTAVKDLNDIINAQSSQIKELHLEIIQLRNELTRYRICYEQISLQQSVDCDVPTQPPETCTE